MKLFNLLCTLVLAITCTCTTTASDNQKTIPSQLKNEPPCESLFYDKFHIRIKQQTTPFVQTICKKTLLELWANCDDNWYEIAHVSVSHFVGSPCGLIDKLFVTDSWRKSDYRVGSHLFKAAVNYLLSCGCTEIEIHVYPLEYDNNTPEFLKALEDLELFYSKLGAVKKIDPNYLEPQDTGILMHILLKSNANLEDLIKGKRPYKK